MVSPKYALGAVGGLGLLTTDVKVDNPLVELGGDLTNVLTLGFLGGRRGSTRKVRRLVRRPQKGRGGQGRWKGSVAQTTRTTKRTAAPTSAPPRRAKSMLPALRIRLRAMERKLGGMGSNRAIRRR